VHTQQAGDPSRLELDEQIDVTVSTEFATESRAEELQAADSVRAAERLKTLIIDRGPGCQLHRDKSHRSISPCRDIPATRTDQQHRSLDRARLDVPENGAYSVAG
jgi:hypothetical protein